MAREWDDLLCQALLGFFIFPVDAVDRHQLFLKLQKNCFAFMWPFLVKNGE